MDYAWMDKAQCKDVDASSAFTSRQAQKEFINIYCAYCPVVDECLAYALNMGSNMQYGPMGGQLETVRRTMLYQRRPSKQKN